MKIGIVTEPLWGNFGGLLQNYALQQVLIKMGYSPITLELMRKRSGLKNLVFQVKNIYKRLIGKRSHWLIPYAPLRHNTKIALFIKDHIKSTDTLLNSFPSLLVNRLGLDAVIVGSDQVWRPKYNPNLTNMFLDFIDNRNIIKLAYAASFGTSNWEYSPSQQKECSYYLDQFKGVSVREESGLRLLEKLHYHEGVEVVDPTILLGRQGFDELLKEREKKAKDRNYLGAYILDPNNEIREKLKEIQGVLELPKAILIQEKNSEMDPIDWIISIKNSSFFVTDSFHGTVFCLLYHIPFVTLVNASRGADRFLSLLRPLGLEGALVWSIKDLVNVKMNYDWKMVDQKLNDARNKSMLFLNSGLSSSFVQK